MPRGDIFGKVITIITVPMLIIIGLVIFGNFASVTDQTFKVDYTNESFTGLTAPTNVTLAHPPAVDSSLAVYNDSAQTNQLVRGTDWDVWDLEDGDLEILTNVGGNVYVDYTGHGGSGWSEAKNVKNTSYSGFNLASVLPIVIAGVAVLGIIISAFTFARQ